jgi:hypothetical protein
MSKHALINMGVVCRCIDGSRRLASRYLRRTTTRWPSILSPQPQYHSQSQSSCFLLPIRRWSSNCPRSRLPRAVRSKAVRRGGNTALWARRGASALRVALHALGSYGGRHARMDARAHQGPVSRRRHVSMGARERRRVAGYTGTLWCVGADAHQEGQWRVSPLLPLPFSRPR